MIKKEQNLKYLKTISFATILGLCSLFISCESSSNSETSTNTESVVPELLQRNDKIQNGKEWDQVQNAFADQKTSLAKNAEDNEAKLNLSLLYIKEARITGEHGHYYPAALKMVDQVLSSKEINDDVKFRALLTKAGVQLSLHEFSEAKKIGLQAIKLNPYNAQAYGVMVDCHVELGEYKEAIIMADKMISIKPDIRSYSRISYLREIHGDIEGAKSAMKLAVEAGYPGTEETAWAMQTLGEMYHLYKQPAKAKKIFETILASRSNYPFAVGALAQLEFDAGNFEVSKRIIKEAIDIIPEVSFYVLLADIYKAEGETEYFNKTIEEIMVMLQDDVDSGHNMNLEYADVYLDLLEDTDSALKYVQLEYDKRPNNIDVNRMMAKIYKMKKDFTASNQYKMVALQTNSKHPGLAEL